MTTIVDTEPRPATPLDFLLGELLDLQHDLADVVVWLAENWPDDLPALRPVCSRWGCRSPAQLELWANCSLDELTRAAHLLHVIPIEDHEPDPSGLRYSNARRAFGRVTIRVYTILAVSDPATEPAP